MKELIKEELRMKEQVKEETKEQEKLLCPKAGTATSSPTSSMEPSNKQSILHDAVNEERKPMLSELLEELLWS